MKSETKKGSGVTSERVERIATDLLIPYARNARTHSEQQVAQIAGSIQEFGFCNPVLIDAQNGIIAGHGRVLAAQKLKLETVPCIRLGHLTEAQKRAYILADNRIALSSGWDEAMLANELSDLHADDFDMALLGFDADELASLLKLNDAEQQPAGEIVEDEVPEPPADPITKPGDLWILGEHRLLCGDSTKAEDAQRLMAGAKADMMFTDPPYGVAYSGGMQFQKDGTVVTNNREALANDENAEIYSRFLPVALKFVDGPCYLWFADSEALPVYQAVSNCKCVISALLIWHKTNATYGALNAQYKQRHEPCLYFKPKGSTLRWVGPSDACTLWEFKRDGVNSFHPTQKPVALAANALKNHKAETVLDMFCGSGSTLIAAEQLNRKCYGMEISPAYCDVIVKRWENLTGKKAVLEAS